MCKVFFVAGIKPQHQEKVSKLTKEMAKIFARTDNDGFGYAAITNKGRVYGEKWLKKDDIFNLHHQPKAPPSDQLITDLLGDMGKLKVETSTTDVYNAFGVPRSKDVLNNTVAVIFHARKKTIGDISIENCHPFYEPETKHSPDTAIIHNGGIVNHGSLTKKYSTCDSEVILHEYLKEAMFYNPWAMPNLSKALIGAYTVGTLSSTSDDKGNIIPVLDIFKSNKELHCAYVKELETFIFSTWAYSIEEACKEAGFTALSLAEVKDGYLLRLNAITGKRMEELIPFELSRQYDNTWSQNYQRKETIDPDLSIDKAKKDFEKNHTDLFNAPYYDLSSGLTPEETEFYKNLEVDKNVDLRALRLVKKVMGL